MRGAMQRRELPRERRVEFRDVRERRRRPQRKRLHQAWIVVQPAVLGIAEQAQRGGALRDQQLIFRELRE